MTKTKLDRRRKYYLVLDCETATLPYAHSYEGESRKKISIAKPLIYDLGWQIIDIQGRVYKKESFLITEIFSVPSIFNTAYYASKRPNYISKLNNGEITLTDWNTATDKLIADLESVEAVGAYNSMFDFKKAIPFTEQYIRMLYSQDYYKWEKIQNDICDRIVAGEKFEKLKEFNPMTFCFRGREYDLFDLWGLSCEHLLNNDEYKKICQENQWQTTSKKYYTTTAEKAYAFCFDDLDFSESHTALEDAIVESMLFTLIAKKTKHKFERGIEYFPFRKLGRADI